MTGESAPDPRQAVDPTLNVELIAMMWREHAECNWVSDGTNVRWSCGIIHPGPIHTQPTTRDRHFAALLVTQIDAERALARRDVLDRLRSAIAARQRPTDPECPHGKRASDGAWCAWMEHAADQPQEPPC